jgi:hypothetical protein
MRTMLVVKFRGRDAEKLLLEILEQGPEPVLVQLAADHGNARLHGEVASDQRHADDESFVKDEFVLRWNCRGCRVRLERSYIFESLGYA